MTLQEVLNKEIEKYLRQIDHERSLFNDDELNTILRISHPDCIVLVYASSASDHDGADMAYDMQTYINKGVVKEMAHYWLDIGEAYYTYQYPILLIKTKGDHDVWRE